MVLFTYMWKLAVKSLIIRLYNPQMLTIEKSSGGEKDLPRKRGKNVYYRCREQGGNGTGELQRGKEDVDKRGNVGENKTERSCGNSTVEAS